LPNTLNCSPRLILVVRLSELIASRQSFLIACSIPVRDVARSLEEADRALEQGADLVEFRIDYYAAPRAEDYYMCVEEILKSFSKPKIITVREVSEGGVNEVPSDVKLEILKRLSRLDNTFVDIELDFVSKYREHIALSDYAGVIVSRHYFYDKPSLSDLVYLYSKAKALGNVDVFKVASMVLSSRDLLPLLQFLCEYAADTVPYVAVLPMGNIRRFRVLPLLLFSKLTYCTLSEATAPGQIPLDVCVKLRELIEKIWV